MRSPICRSVLRLAVSLGVMLSLLMVDAGCDAALADSAVDAVRGHQPSVPQSSFFSVQKVTAQQKDTDREAFAKKYTRRSYLEKLQWDPRQARFFKDVRDKMHLQDSHVQALRQNGFVVIDDPNYNALSFGDLLYDIYSRDLPLFISSDAILHAWHRSFAEAMINVEQQSLQLLLDDMLHGVAAPLHHHHGRYQGALAGARLEVSRYIDVALALLEQDCLEESESRGTLLDPKSNKSKNQSFASGPLGKLSMPSFALCEKFSSSQKQRLDAQTQTLIDAVGKERPARVDVLGKKRDIDFSLFRPRGHYSRASKLHNYFRSMMWLGHVDIQLKSPQDMAMALVLLDAMERAHKFAVWKKFDQVLEDFYGWSDNLNFSALHSLIKAAGYQQAAEINTTARLKNFLHFVRSQGAAAQKISAHLVVLANEAEAEDKVPPPAFAFIGQRFSLDSWASARVTYPHVKNKGRTIARRKMSGVDVAYSVFANDDAAAILARRMADSAGLAFRDGLPCQNQLLATRDVIDGLPEQMWRSTLYTGWLGALRALSRPTLSDKYPQMMRTRAWAMKNLNTQLASWTQLRHDSILYVKQARTVSIGCFYPSAYVEPRPLFWHKMQKLALLAAEHLGTAVSKQKREMDFAKIRRRFFTRFAENMGKLEKLAKKELNGTAFSAADIDFLRSTVERSTDPYTQRKQYSGWYPSLFIGGPNVSGEANVLVSDLFTDSPSPEQKDPGAVLHGAVGKINPIVLAVESGDDKMIFVGGLMSFYEFERPYPQRMNDQEWKKQLDRSPPKRPLWAELYLRGKE